MSQLEPEWLKQYLLYWDKIDYPFNGMFEVSPSPDMQVLIDEGIMSRTDLRGRFASLTLPRDLVPLQLAALEELSNKEPGVWSLAQRGTALILPHDLPCTTRCAEIELYNALPTPGDEISFQDVLEFKARRQSELRALRAAMDGLYLEIENNADIPRAKIAAIGRLERSLNDLHQVVNESWPRKMLASLKVEIRLPNIALGYFGGETFGAPLGIPLVGGALGAAASVVKFDLNLGPALAATSKDFAYLHSIDRELR